jgi:hypothetical protein
VKDSILNKRAPAYFMADQERGRRKGTKGEPLSSELASARLFHTQTKKGGNAKEKKTKVRAIPERSPSVRSRSRIKKTIKLKIAAVETSAVQTTIDQIQEELVKASLGYAMMDVMSDDDLGRGPTMTCQTINIREINRKFLKQFSTQVKGQGLANKEVANAIVVGVKPRLIEKSSLAVMKPGHYTNVVKWTPAARNDGAEMVLYNGNHRRTYMRTSSNVVIPYHQYLLAKKDLAAPQDEQTKTALGSALKTTSDLVETHGKWLVHFVNQGKQKISGRPPIHSDERPRFRHHTAVRESSPPGAHIGQQRPHHQFARRRG